MKNASSVLLPYADSVTDFTNNEDGVARQLIQLFFKTNRHELTPHVFFCAKSVIG